MDADVCKASFINSQLSQATNLCKVNEFYIENSCLTVISLEDFPEHEDSDTVANTLNNNLLLVLGYFEFDKKRYAVIYIPDALEKPSIALTSLLTERELQIATLIASGQSNKQVANQLHISEWTVSAHLRRIFIKLNVDSRTAMVYKCASLINQRMQ
jgi:DNA-binding CsgD family transcriptional regulator